MLSRAFCSTQKLLCFVINLFQNDFDRNTAMKNFIKNIKVLISYSKKVKLLIENNVVSKRQFKNLIIFH